MTMPVATTKSVEAKVEAVHGQLLRQIDDGERLAIVKAPPGSGKTYLLIKAARHACRAGSRVAVATQTNTQADDICRRLSAEKAQCYRFASDSYPKVDLGQWVAWETKSKNLPHGPCIVVGTSAKWGLVNLADSFDLLFVEEAWQLSWADFMLLRQVSERFVLIGDPGQVAPVVSTDVSRWATSPRPPHRAAPEVILEDAGISGLHLSLPATRRLPSDSAKLVRNFYSFDFEATAKPGDRVVEPGGPARDPLDRVLDLLREGSAVGYTLSTSDEGPPLECDDEVAAAAVEVVTRLLERKTVCLIDGERRPLGPGDVGLCATHRIMNGAMDMRLPASLRGLVRVDTPERWQGLECKVLVMVHPLSGVVMPSSFDLDTGRLCVMASRHRAGLVVVTRDHLSATLEEFLPCAEQPVGHPDAAGRGHARNLAFWGALERDRRIVARGN